MKKTLKMTLLLPIGIVPIVTMVSCAMKDAGDVAKVASGIKKAFGIENSNSNGSMNSTKTPNELLALKTTNDKELTGSFLADDLGITLLEALPDYKGCSVKYSFTVTNNLSERPSLRIVITKGGDSNYDNTESIYVSIIDVERQKKYSVEKMSELIQKALILKNSSSAWESDKEAIKVSKLNTELPSSVESWTELTSDILTNSLGINLKTEFPTDLLNTFIYYKFAKNSSSNESGHRVDIKIQSGEFLSEFWFSLVDSEQFSAQENTVDSIKLQIMNSIKSGWTNEDETVKVRSAKSNRYLPNSTASGVWPQFTSSTLKDFGVDHANPFPTNLNGSTITYKFSKKKESDTGNEFLIKIEKGFSSKMFNFYLQDEDQWIWEDVLFVKSALLTSLGSTTLASGHTYATMPPSANLIWLTLEQSAIENWLASPIASNFPTDLRGTKLLYKFTKSTVASTPSKLTIIVSRSRGILYGPTESSIDVSILSVEQTVPHISSIVKNSIKTGWTTSSTVVNSSKTNSELPSSISSSTQLTTDVLKETFGLNATLRANLMGVNLTYTFTKNASTNKSGSELVITATKGNTSETFTVYLVDRDQA